MKRIGPAEAPDSALAFEALILSDHAGALYEVPRAVIERYRLSQDEAALVAQGSAAGGGETALRWSVEGAVYAPS